MKKIRWKRTLLLAGCLLLAVLAAAGCGGGETTVKGPTGREKPGMGRYVESERSRSGGSGSTGMVRHSDGKLAYWNLRDGFYVSEDEGAHWARQEAEWTDQLPGIYPMFGAVSPDGAAAVAKWDYDEVLQDMSQEELAGLSQEEVRKHELLRCFYIDPEGKWMELSSLTSYIMEAVDSRAGAFYFSEDGRLFITDDEGAVYEADRESGEVRQLFQLNTRVFGIGFLGDTMVAAGASETVLYDLKQGEQKERDEVLNAFLSDTLNRQNMGSSNNSRAILIQPAEEENTLYCVSAQGIYRHTLYGSMMEKVIDGTFCSMSTPGLGLLGMTETRDGAFLIQYDDGSFCQYLYDETVPSVPEKEVSVYSLEDNAVIRQEIAMYQKQHPDTVVRYTVGLSGEDGVTKEDAIRNLNKELLAGKGPDVLVMDGLPMESYRQQGVLKKLDELLAAMPEEGQVMEPMKKVCAADGSAYGVPLYFSLPLLAGPKSVVDQAADLKGLADAAEMLREQNSQYSIVGTYDDPEALLHLLSMCCQGSWLRDGRLDTAALTEFLTQAKRIYEAENSGDFGYPYEQFHAYQERLLEYNATYDSRVDAVSDYSRGAFPLLLAQIRHTFPDLSQIVSYWREQKPGEMDFILFRGQTEGGFLPEAVLGINAAGQDQETAAEFVTGLLLSDYQKDMYFSGFSPAEAYLKAANRSYVDSLRENNKETKIGFGASTETSYMADTLDGQGTFMIDWYWPSEEQILKLEQIVSDLKEPLVQNDVLEQTVTETGAAVLTGEKDIQTAVAEIEKQMEIYLAE